MAQNFKHKGDVLVLSNASGSAITSGSVVLKGNMVGVALVDIADGASGAIAVEGVFELPKATGTAITQGDIVTWDIATKKVTKDITGNDPIIGIATIDAASNATVVEVSIDEKPSQAAVVAAVTTANGSDAATTQALANQLKTTVNGILTSLKNAGIMAS